MRTKTQILEEMKETMPFSLSEKIRPYIEEAMEIYSKQQLSQSNFKLDLAISGLKAIEDPIAYFKNKLKEGETLNGMGVIRMLEKTNFYENIAKDALFKIGKSHGESN